MSWRVTVRAEHRVTRSRFDDLARALDALERRGRGLAATAPSQLVDVKLKQFAPAEQVSARLELAGPERLVPSVRAGVDVRGDGSTRAFRGGIRRVELDQRTGEDAFRALRRSLADVLEAAGS